MNARTASSRSNCQASYHPIGNDAGLCPRQLSIRQIPSDSDIVSIGQTQQKEDVKRIRALTLMQTHTFAASGNMDGL
eukprot:scaffold256326_cov15-Tisochrysis_lutea.AAC.1